MSADERVYFRLSELGIANHFGHPWTQVGRCVYCAPCGERLYHGTIPEGHPVATPKPRTPQNDPATAMLAKWGKA